MEYNEFFYAPMDWKLALAEAHAQSVGLRTKWEGKYLLIEKRYHKAGFNHQGAEDIPDWPGYSLDMDPGSWNGWECPYFTRETVDKLKSYYDEINKGYPEGEYDTIFKWDGEDILVTWEGYTDRISPHQIKFNNEFITVYDMQLGWTWIKSNPNDTNNL